MSCPVIIKLLPEGKSEKCGGTIYAMHMCRKHYTLKKRDVLKWIETESGEERLLNGVVVPYKIYSRCDIKEVGK